MKNIYKNGEKAVAKSCHCQIGGIVSGIPTSRSWNLQGDDCCCGSHTACAICCMLFLLQSVASVDAQSRNTSVPVSFTLQDAAPSCSPNLSAVRSNLSFGSWRPDPDAADAGWVEINPSTEGVTFDNMTSVTSGEQATRAEIELNVPSSCPPCSIEVAENDLTHESNTIGFRFSIYAGGPYVRILHDVEHQWPVGGSGDHTYWFGGLIFGIDSSMEPGRYTGTISVTVTCS